MTKGIRRIQEYFFPALYVLVVSIVPAFADVTAETSALTRGRAIAENRCAICHAIYRSDASPTRINANTAFRDLHERYPIPMLVEAATTGKVEGHDEMPAFDFSSTEIKDLLIYIDSFSPDTTQTYIGRF